MSKITIVDAIMGSGKSTYAINKIINNNNKKFICVLPTNEECKRYVDNVNCEFAYTDDDDKRIGTKTEYFKSLIKQNKNVATTHWLIEHLDNEIIDILKTKDYVLIIDECLDVVHKLDWIKASDVKLLFNDKWIYPDDNGYLKWNKDKDESYDGIFRQIRDLCETDSLMVNKLKNGNISNDKLMWNFPYKFFDLFTQTYIFTYMWNGSNQKCYFDLHKIKYKHCTLQGNQLKAYDRTLEIEKRRQLKQLISIHGNHKENSIGIKNGKSYPLTKGWYEKNSKGDNKIILEILKRHTYNYFHNIKKCKTEEAMFTVYKDYKKYVKGKGYTKGFVPCNSKGTNEYKNKSVLAYLIDFHMPPENEQFFNGYGIHLDKNLLSLSELVQWIWRSRIREGKPISIYIPSERMRNLLIQWLDCDI